VLQPFAALYVLILASASPWLAKESERIQEFATKLVSWRPKGEKHSDEESEEVLKDLEVQ